MAAFQFKPPHQLLSRTSPHPHSAADQNGYIWTQVVGQSWVQQTYAGIRDWSFVTADGDGNVLAGTCVCVRNGEWKSYCGHFSSGSFLMFSLWLSIIFPFHYSAGVAGGSIYLYVNGNWVRSAAEGNWSHGDLEQDGTKGKCTNIGWEKGQRLRTCAFSYPSNFFTHST